MQDYEPRIIARGEWTQDENGDTTYYPAHRRPQVFRQEPGVVTGWADLDHGGEANHAVWPGDDNPVPDVPDDRPLDGRPHDDRTGYRIRSDAVWDRARADFLVGDTAAAVCDRHDLSLGTFKARSAREGWRRSDQPDPEPVDLDAEPPVAPADLAAMAAQALIRARRAMDRGRAVEAGRWLRVHGQLTKLIAVETPKPAKVLREPDPLDLLTLKMKAAGDIARAAAGISEDNEHGHAQISRLIAELKTMPTGGSDHSDHSDPVVVEEAEDDELPSPLAGEGSPEGRMRGGIGRLTQGPVRRTPHLMTQTPHPSGSAAHLLPQGEKEGHPVLASPAATSPALDGHRSEIRQP